MLCMLVLCIDNISLNIDKDGILTLKEYLKKCEISEEVQNAEILLELKLQEKEERECYLYLQQNSHIISLLPFYT